MQAIGYVIDSSSNEKVLLLVRVFKYGKWLKIRKTGRDGSHFQDEEKYLNDFDAQAFDRLKNGESICL